MKNKNEKTNYVLEVILRNIKFFKYVILELADGIQNSKIDLTQFVYPGMFVGAFYAFKLDAVLAWITGVESFEISYELRKVVVLVSVFAGWIVWACMRAHQRIKLLNKLTDAFIYCGLIANEKVPNFIEDLPIDNHVRNLKLFTQGIPLKKFLEVKEGLESFLNISIVQMREENGDKGRINILYATESLASMAVLDDSYKYVDGEIPIGISYEGPVSVNLRDVAHILVAGQTGGGKSNFEKLVTTVLTENNEEANVYFLDFKGGMELADLTNKLGDHHKNFFKYEGPKACANFLSDLGEKIESRLKELASLGASSLDEYQKKLIGSHKLDEDGTSNRSEPLKRTYLIIDEIAQLYAKDPTITKDILDKARSAVNRIARQGRAAGVHLVVATQKPDATSFDQTVKANLPAVLCFPMATQAASVSAIGTKRAFDLNPDVKGRAVWKFGPKTVEVQTYLFQ